MYHLVKTPNPDNRFDHTTVKFNTDTVCLNKLIETFEGFLRGCGFHFDGHLEILAPETEEEVYDKYRKQEVV